MTTTRGSEDADADGEVEESRMSLIDHLTELRSRLIKSVIAVVAGAIVCFIFREFILDFLISPYCDVQESVGTTDANGECRGLLVINPLDNLRVPMTIAGYGGIALAMPVLLWQAWRFVAPGLYPHEKKYSVLFVVSSLTLFVLGAALAYWSLPRALEFFEEIGGANLESRFGPAEYIGLVTKMMVGFGVAFEFPIVLIFLQAIDLLENKTLRANRQYAIVGIVILVAVITPSGDPWTLLVLSGPMYLFYEIAIIYGRLRLRRQKKQARAAAA